MVSEAFVRFFVETVGHYSLFLAGEREERTLQREAFRKAVSSKSLRRFLEVFMETQMFRGFAQERELRRQDARGLFEVRAQEYLETLPSGEHSGVNRFLKGLGKARGPRASSPAASAGARSPTTQSSPASASLGISIFCSNLTPKYERRTQVAPAQLS